MQIAYIFFLINLTFKMTEICSWHCLEEKNEDSGTAIIYKKKSNMGRCHQTSIIYRLGLQKLRYDIMIMLYCERKSHITAVVNFVSELHL